MECGLLLDVVVRQGTSILQLLTCKDQALLLVRRDALLVVLELLLDSFNGAGRFNFQGDGLASKGFDENLHANSQAEHQMECGLPLDIIVRQCTALLQLLASKDQALLARWDAFLVLDLLLDVFDGVRRLDMQGDGIAGEGFDKNLHDGRMGNIIIFVLFSAK